MRVQEANLRVQFAIHFSSKLHLTKLDILGRRFGSGYHTLIEQIYTLSQFKHTFSFSSKKQKKLKNKASESRRRDSYQTGM